jgi:4-hydroxy-4-methyl-2-oxoglutarate aldolase
MRERLSRLDTCVLSDALDRHSLQGVATGIVRQATKLSIAGRVLTVRLEPADGRTSTGHLATTAVEQAEPGDVIVIEHHSRSDCAGWGGLLSHAASFRNLAGAIVDGMCRDQDESDALGFPVFARGCVPRTARGRVIQTGFGIPIQIGGITVSPGDWVRADGTGVVFVSASSAEEVIATAENLAEREREMLAAIRGGTPVTQVMSATYEKMAGERLTGK